MEQFDLIIIGAGPGGYEAAAEAAKQYKMNVALVENRGLGGTCLNRGCIPTKTILHSASYYHEMKAHGGDMGLTRTEDIGYSMEQIQARKNQVLDQLRSGVAMLMKANKITVYNGTGTIIDRNTVKVNGNDGTIEKISANNIMIATGSIPAVPPIKGSDLKGVVTSDAMLNLDKPINSLIVIGGGVIGMEFASVFGALGCTVTVIEALDKILGSIDKEICQNLKMILKKVHGVDIHTGATVTEISGTPGAGTDGMTVSYTEKEKECQVSADLVLMSVGRRAYMEGLFDDDTVDEVRNITVERGKIIVDEKYTTSVPGIYAIGDVIGGIQLAHVATAEGRSAVAYMNGEKPSIDMSVVPSCVYTSPEIASVGISPDDAKKLEMDVITSKYIMGANGKSILSMQERGFIKVVADAKSHKVIGAQMMCARATDMISQFSQAIVSGLTIEDMSKTIYPHPTFSEGIGEALKG